MIRRIIGHTLVFLTIAVGGTLVAAAPASAAYPTCTTKSYRPLEQGTYGYLPSTSSGDLHCNLRQGNYNNDAVKVLQNALNRWAGGSPYLTVDGDFGPATKARLLAVQSGWGYPADGIYGPINDLNQLYWPTGSAWLPTGTSQPTTGGY